MLAAPKTCRRGLLLLGLSSLYGALADPGDVGNGVEFGVTLRSTYQPQGVNGVMNIYYDDYLSGSNEWTAQFAKSPLLSQYGYWGGATFKYLQTYQYVLTAGDRPQSLNVQDNHGAGGSGARCAAALYKEKFLWFPLGQGGSLDLTKLPAPTAIDPLHLTIVPTQYSKADCNPAGPVESLRAISVWISVPPARQEPPAAPRNVSNQLCHFTVGGDPLGNGCLSYPVWQYVQAENGRAAVMIFKGSLVDLFLQSRDANIPVPTIRIDEGVDLGNLPLNAMLVRMTVQSGSEQACQYYDYNNCHVTAGESVTLDAEQPITIVGYGRVNGYQQLLNNRNSNPSLQSQWFNYASRPWSTSLSNIKGAAQYHLYSGLLVLSSSVVSATTGFSIDIAGITVGYGPTRNQGAVQLNSAYCPAVKTLNGVVDETWNAKPTRMLDVKVVGNWIGASDGPEVMGPGSSQSYMYLQVNDDSIKVGAPRMAFSSMTVLQGNSGGVIDIGCYGLNRGVSGSSLDGVYVHRLLHNTLNNGVPGYDGFNGIVSTRTCPRVPFPGGDEQAGLVDVVVRNLVVPGLGWLGSADDGNNFGPNSISAPFAVSVNPSGSCNWGGGGLSSTFVVSGLRFEKWQLFVRPAYPSVIASYPLSETTVRWGSDDGTPSVWLGEADGQVPSADSMLFYPEGSLGSLGIYQCATGSKPGSSEPHCFNTCGEGGRGCQPSPGTSSNLLLIDSAGVIGKSISFPFSAQRILNI